NVFEEIEKQIDSLIESEGYSLTNDKMWYYYRNMTSIFFEKGKESFPGITYLLNGTKMYGGKELILRIETSDLGLYSGFALLKKYKDTGKCVELASVSDSDKQRICQFVNISHFDNDTPFYSLWLPSGQNGADEPEENIPDFREMNDAAIKLVDEEYRKEFVEKSINVIQEKLLSLII
ncbi:MAG: hypothetical protein IKK69_06630, partial [Firmicutes bacterium]|nr:hypothetical protein [Bacillota bacterium]